MSFSRCLLTSTVLAGVVFSAATLPLTVTGSKLVTIQWEEETVFTGQLKELAAPYLSLVTAMSLGLGAISLATLGWRRTSQKLASTEEKMTVLTHQLKEQDILLEDLKFSPVKLDTQGLEFFLQDESQVSKPSPVMTSAVSEYTVVETNPSLPQSALTPASISASFVNDSKPTDLTPVVSSHAKHQAATALASAQAFKGFARPVLNEPSHPSNPDNVVQLDALLTHLKQVMAQIEQLHGKQNGKQTSLEDGRTHVAPLLEQEVAA